MANKNSQGFGLRMAMRVGNTPAIQGQSKYQIDAGHGANIFQGEPVKVNLHAATGGYLTTAAAGTAMVGTLNGEHILMQHQRNQLLVTTFQQELHLRIVKTCKHLLTMTLFKNTSLQQTLH